MDRQSQNNKANRLEKMNSLLQQLVGEAIRPYLEGQNGLVTVSKVETSGDTKWAKIWISIIGGDDDKILSVLQKNIYDIQGDVNRKMTLKMIPRLQFFLDTSPRYAQHINELIKKIHDDEGVVEGEAEDER
jgi:ribosome-binding factor A